MSDYFLFDLDNTLYPRDCGLFDRVDALINDYLETVVGIPPERVDYLRRDYFARYGTTLSGLMRHHGVEPDHYLDYVHAVPVAEIIPPDPVINEALAALPGRKYIFSNASRRHCERVLAHLGIATHFEEIFDIIHFDYRPKPEPGVYRQVIGRVGGAGCKGVMVDDLVANLRPARAAGLKTILVDPAAGAAAGGRVNGDRNAPPVDAVAVSVHEVGGIVSRWRPRGWRF
ncbi:MAG: pyrimidine 5'-nucleotidase [Deltaproteobacteria bacterium]|nr:pyrimidine 5'-nucleotidase [Candidatus Anaeroferrophillacea bacterium]